MTAAARPPVAPRRRTTIRVRLTLTYAGLVTGCGAVLIAIVWVFMRFVPYYSFTSSRAGTTTTVSPAQSDGVSFAVTDEWDFLQLLLFVSLATLAGLAVLSGVIGWIVAGRVLRPLAAINAAATLAAAGSFDHRVGLRGPRDEIQDLSDTFDAMLGELGRSFEAQRRFAANASHELQTPLATTQTMIDVALADPDADVEALRDLLGRIRTVNRSNARTVESLLDLADIGRRGLALRPVDLRTLADEAALTAGPLARDGAVAVTVQTTGPSGHRSMALADPVLLTQCLANLVQNAVRYNHRGGTVRIVVSPGDDHVEVAVTNTGPPVAEDVVDALLEPFVRGAGRTSRTGDRRGRGLGLAIAAAIAEAHDGSLRLTANHGGGITARLRIPAAPVTPA